MTIEKSREPFAFGYARVSTVAQALEGLGLDAQQQQIEAYYHYCLEKEGFAWAGFFIDDGVSGKVSLRDRPAGSKLFAELEAGDAAVFAKLDRAFRNVLDMLETLQLLKARRVRMIFLDLPGADSGTDFGALILAVFGAFAEFERARIRERIRDAFAAARAKGVPGPRYPPYGFVYQGKAPNRKQVPYPQEREITRKVIAWRLEGWLFDTILKHLKEQGVKTKLGSDYSAGVLVRGISAELDLQKKEALDGTVRTNGPTPADVGPEHGGDSAGL